MSIFLDKVTNWFLVACMVAQEILCRWINSISDKKQLARAIDQDQGEVLQRINTIVEHVDQISKNVDISKQNLIQ